MEKNISPLPAEAEAIISRLSKPDRRKIRQMLANKDKIISVESFKNKKVIHYQGIPDAEVTMNWNDMRTLLPGKNFRMVHKSFLVHFKKVQNTFNTGRDDKAAMREGPDIPISRKKSRKFKEKCRNSRTCEKTWKKKPTIGT